MRDFHLGQRVICVNAEGTMTRLVKGQEYIVRWHGPVDFGPQDVPALAELAKAAYGIRVRGIIRGDGTPDFPYNAARFQPLEPKVMEVFRQIAQNTKQPVHAE